jgi:hypothetical protein
MRPPPDPSAGLVASRLLYLHPEYPRYFHPRGLIRVGAVRHLLVAALEGGLVELRMLSGVLSSELYQLGDDLAAHRGTFIVHTSTVGATEQVFQVLT